MSKKQVICILLLTVSLLASGCMGEDGTKLSISGNDTEINVSLPEQSEGNWCPVGSQVQVKNPTTGKALNMKITGTEEFENKTLCRAMIETGSEDNTTRYEYMWSQDKNTTIWTKYGEDGNISIRYIYTDGKKTIIDGAGRTLEFGIKA
ncbi:hypothetical protein EO98_18315 [Methanosarcina sp. 2.H.T.1A.6]|uniref:hypothetical protein n=1 Tax=unclassified Methanosarcina TaxID=2644672 RepID=UPI000621D0D2|nr:MULTISPECIES: hypothetical protein [unclassified Methanosarcina]KKG17091.1 hypothetical protein EO94_18575 [Methanosarcina sp. 2.H.T.1A.3]KKG20286.1 hypothetical protein EO98_18315 [Methanosarcina sp. 2.H.T.1A.6]KKG23450.1 hypothetical protein EO96_17540 [Methanosarcina sp. 2.H.T.1A.8]KKG27303.1 hypothetical protein EO97_02865 [Methanosarcina sp. 2.H.T.1A.15]